MITGYHGSPDDFVSKIANTSRPPTWHIPALHHIIMYGVTRVLHTHVPQPKVHVVGAVNFIEGRPVRYCSTNHT